MKVLVAYNAPGPAVSHDYLCHAGVEDEVRNVVAALQKLGHHTTTLAIGYHLKQELMQVAQTDADCVFNLCESIAQRSSYQPCFAGYLELLGVPFTGAGSTALNLAIDKRLTKAVLRSVGVQTPESWHGADLLSKSTLPAPLRPQLPFPLIVKPACEDGSIGIEQRSVVGNWPELASVLMEADKRFGANGVLVERYIEGREYTVAMLGNADTEVLPMSELTFVNSPAGYRPILSYQMKWVMNSAERRAFQRICPAHPAPEAADQIITACRLAYRAIGLSGYGRIDVRYETATQTAYVIDVNANPDITDAQGLPFMAQVAGITYPQLIERILQYAVDHKNAQAPAAISA